MRTASTLTLWRAGEIQFYCPHFASKELRCTFSVLPKVMLETDGRVGIKTNFVTICEAFAGRVLCLH